MKIELEYNEKSMFASALRDLTTAVVVARLKESVRDCAIFNKHPDDKAYNKKYVAAAKVVIKHFGG